MKMTIFNTTGVRVKVERLESSKPFYVTTISVTSGFNITDELQLFSDQPVDIVMPVDATAGRVSGGGGSGGIGSANTEGTTASTGIVTEEVNE